MIDLKQLREDPKLISSLIKRKDPSFDIESLIAYDQEVIRLRKQVEEIRAQKNHLADQAKAGVTDEIRRKSTMLTKELEHVESILNDAQAHFNTIFFSCPNIVQPDVPVGGKHENVVVAQWGQQPFFDFEPKNHLELGTAMGWFDFARAAIMTGSQFPLYKGNAVRLLYALTRLMIEHNQTYGYELVLPPYLINEESLFGSGTFPKFRDQVYRIPEDHLYLSPTSEVGLVNIYRNHIFESKDLPVRLTAWTSCFRREAGGYGSAERGLIRIHQFEKVELFTFCKPEDAAIEQERMLECAQKILQVLELPYRISLLAGQDCSFASARTYDIEVWMAGQKAFYEVSSISNCLEFQARRAQIRYRPSPQAKTEFIYTLNGSSLALPRLMVALMEHYQQADGSVRIPSILTQYGY